MYFYCFCCIFVQPLDSSPQSHFVRQHTGVQCSGLHPHTSIVIRDFIFEIYCVLLRQWVVIKCHCLWRVSLLFGECLISICKFVILKI